LTTLLYITAGKYNRTPHIEINWDGEPSGYAKNSDDGYYPLKLGYIGGLKWGKRKFYKLLF